MWVKLDDRKSGSTPVTRAWQARRSPLVLHYLAELHAGAQETDGRIDQAQVQQWVPSAAERRRFTAVLVETGLWDECDGGWQLVGFLETNPTSAELILRRAADAKRKMIERNPSLRRAVRVRDHGCCRYCGSPVSAGTQHNGDSAGGSFVVVDPVASVSIANVVVSCISCKRIKGHLPDREAGLALMPEPLAQTLLAPNVHPDSARTSSALVESSPPDPSRPVPTRPDPKAGRRR